jgi:hypothetical protein
MIQYVGEDKTLAVLRYRDCKYNNVTFRGSNYLITYIRKLFKIIVIKRERERERERVEKINGEEPNSFLIA